jgi:hypothetical protein
LSVRRRDNPDNKSRKSPSSTLKSTILMYKMGQGKNVEKASPEIPYSGALKKLFDPIIDANFSIRAANLIGSGRMYKIKKGNTSRQWSLQVLKSGSTLSIVPAVDGRAGLETTPTFGNAPSLIVQTLKTTYNFIVLWVFNLARSSANLVFNEGEDFFSCDPLVCSILELEGRLGNGIAVEALVQPVNGLHGTFANISKGLRKLMKVMANTAAGQSNVVKVPRPVGRRRLVEAAPSREEAAGWQEAIPLGRQEVIPLGQQEAIPLGLTEQEGSGTAAMATIVATQDRVFPHYVPNSSIKHSKSDSKDRSQEIL